MYLSLIFKSFLKILLVSSFSFLFILSSVYFYRQSNKQSSILFPKELGYVPLEYTQEVNLLNNSITKYSIPKPIFKVNQKVAESELLDFSESLEYLSVRNEFFYQDQNAGNYISYNTSVPLDRNFYNSLGADVQTKIINTIKLFNYSYYKNQGFVGVPLEGGFILETVDPELNWNGGITFTDSLNLTEKIFIQIDGVSFTINDVNGEVEVRLRVSNNYIGSGKSAGGIFFIRDNLESVFQKLMNSKKTVSYSIGFRDTYEKMYNIQSGINMISQNITLQTQNKIEGDRTLSMLNLSNIIYPEIAYANYVEGWAAGENGIGVRALGGGICAAVSGQWYLMNTLLNSNNVPYNILSHQNHLDKYLNPIPYVVGTTNELDITKTDATIYRDNFVTIDALMTIPGDVKIVIKPVSLVFNADGINPNRLVMFVTSDIALM